MQMQHEWFKRQKLVFSGFEEEEVGFILKGSQETGNRMASPVGVTSCALQLALIPRISMNRLEKRLWRQSQMQYQ